MVIVWGDSDCCDCFCVYWFVGRCNGWILWNFVYGIVYFVDVELVYGYFVDVIFCWFVFLWLESVS